MTRHRRPSMVSACSPQGHVSSSHTSIKSESWARPISPQKDWVDWTPDELKFVFGGLSHLNYGLPKFTPRRYPGREHPDVTLQDLTPALLTSSSASMPNTLPRMSYHYFAF